ncbi:MAG: transposase [Chloroflexota bacterium]
MKGIPQGRYTREFRQEAVKLVTEEKLSLPEAARRLSLPPSTLGYWVKAHRAGKLGDVGKTYRPLTEIEMELAWTKKELAEVKMPPADGWVASGSGGNSRPWLVD